MVRAEGAGLLAVLLAWGCGGGTSPTDGSLPGDGPPPIVLENGDWDLTMGFTRMTPPCEAMQVSDAGESHALVVTQEDPDIIRFEGTLPMVGYRTSQGVVASHFTPSGTQGNGTEYGITVEVFLQNQGSALLVGRAERTFDLPQGLCEVLYEAIARHRPAEDEG